MATITYHDAGGNIIRVNLRDDGTPASASTIAGTMHNEIAKLERDYPPPQGTYWQAVSVCQAYLISTGRMT